ncbi:MAG: clan AA aspartic protease [Bacteroidales bacterium]|nr:clan AA aspartic protease [Bacteroidales bacterium]
MITKLTKEGGLIIVPVTIKGIDSDIQTNFVLDTGAFKTVINNSILFAAGYKNKDFGQKVYTNTAGGRSSGRLIKLKSFKCFDLQRKNFEILGKDLAPNLMIDGLLGIDFLKNHILEIDFKNYVLKFD